MSVYSLIYMFLVKERGHNICCSSDIIEEWHGEVPKKEKKSKVKDMQHCIQKQPDCQHQQATEWSTTSVSQQTRRVFVAFRWGNAALFW